MPPTLRNRIARKMHTNTQRRMPLLPPIIESYFLSSPTFLTNPLLPPYLCVWGLIRASFLERFFSYFACKKDVASLGAAASDSARLLVRRPSLHHNAKRDQSHHPFPTHPKYVGNRFPPPAPILPNKPFERKYSFPHIDTSFFLLLC